MQRVKSNLNPGFTMADLEGGLQGSDEHQLESKLFHFHGEF